MQKIIFMKIIIQPEKNKGKCNHNMEKLNQTLKVVNYKQCKACLLTLIEIIRPRAEPY